MPSGSLRQSEPAETRPLLEVTGLNVHFPLKSRGFVRRHHGAVRAVDGVDLTLERGETLGLVGESGCGKSTTGRAILQLTKATSGSVRYDGVELTTLGAEPMRRMRRRMQMIFQDPQASLDPRMTIGDIVAEPLRVHGLARRDTESRRVRQLLHTVGLEPSYGNRLPHEFSGGQQQRVGIARALAVQPDFVIADEPVSALDVSVQAQIINLLLDLRDEFNLTYLFIAHDLAVVRHIADRVAVMYLGRIVEIAASSDLYADPFHPYTEALLSAVPIPDPEVESRRQPILLSGDVPSPLTPAVGCRFRSRCWKSQEICSQIDPPLAEHEPGHWAACHFPAKASPK